MIEPTKIKIKGEIYTSSGSYFSTAILSNDHFVPNPYADTCRELFASRFKKNTHFVVFGKKYVNIQKVNDFFENIENKLKLKEKTVFYRSDRNIVIMKPSKFWKYDSFRRGMFTLFLRCAACHYNDDIYKALLKYSLTKRIIGPIEHFMKGNTKLSINSTGSNVVNKLSVLNKKEWETYLTK